jgi:hypothetical protein
MTFEDYLISKKIASQDFYAAEKNLWEQWRIEFEQMHPNSFTIQKLNLINPIRRKYPLKEVPKKEMPKEETAVNKPVEKSSTSAETPTSTEAKPAVPKAAPRPVFKPKPKTE